MMQGWRKAIIWLVLLWLPVQGFAAGFMPFACHTHGSDDAIVADAHHHDDHAHHGHELPPADDDGNASHDPACDNCSLCQMCGALALPATTLKGHPLLSGGIGDNMTPLLQSFIPALPHRPPRALLVA